MTGTTAAKGKVQKSSLHKQSFIKTLIKQKSLVMLTIPIVIYIFIFNYFPLWGLTMAFQNYRPGRSFSEQTWVGWKNFERLFGDPRFSLALRNTFAMSFIILVSSLVTAIGLAILLNEISNSRFRRIAQSVTYLPHFLSWVIVCGLVFNFLGTSDGILNSVLRQLGATRNIPWLGIPEYFWWIIGGAHIWKSTGWNSIIYLATITGISPELYEAAYMDGANRFQRMIYITLPGIRSTAVILTIMNLGFIMNAGGMEAQYLLRNGLVADYSDTIDIFVFLYGIGANNFSYATAAGLFKSVVSIIMITLSNTVAKKLGEETLI